MSAHRECPYCRALMEPTESGDCPSCSQRVVLAVPEETLAVAVDAPHDRVAEFQRTLLACTPRLLATPVLIAANFAIYLGMIARGVHFFAPTAQSVLEWGANFGPLTMNGQWWRLATCMFLHFGLLHLLFNMWALWNLGQLVERLVGHLGFVALYAVSGIAGSLASLAWHPTVVSAGASGAVFGVAGALIGLIALHRDTIPPQVFQQLRNSMAFFVLYNVFYGLTNPAIDTAAHLGGLGAGLVCGLILSQPLSPQMATGRRWRSAAVLLLGAVALPAAGALLPPAPPDVDRAVNEFAALEERAVNAFALLAQDVNAGKLSDPEFAERLSRDVLPVWAEARALIEALPRERLEAKTQDFLTRLLEYIRQRETGWELLLAGAQEQDLEKFKQGNEALQQADVMARGLGGQ